jgi:pimeloyl-ACP methyl ester carboxylesterase
MSSVGAAFAAEEYAAAGEPVTLLRGGTGPQIVFLHDEWGVSGHEEFLQELMQHHEVIIPIVPGFLATSPSSLRDVRDLALLFLTLFADLGLTASPVSGASLGGWIALEMTVMRPAAIAQLILLGPVGLRFGPPTDRNFADIYAMEDEELLDTLYLHREASRAPSGSMSEEEVRNFAQCREAVTRFIWEPYLHNPGLERWVAQLATPVTVLSGAEDRFVTAGYYDRFAAVFVDARHEVIRGAGHFPHLDAPSTTTEAVLRSLSG